MVTLRRRGLLVLSAVAGTLGIAVLVSCAKDPRENDPVAPPATCDPAKLSTDPKNPESSLKAYLDSAALLLQRATDVETELKDACNQMATELALPNGQDVIAACKAIGARADGVNKVSPEPPPGFPQWVEMRFAPLCTAPVDAREKCVASCAGPCDVNACEPSKLVGKCAGECKGLCETVGDGIPCQGSCVGSVPPGGSPTTCAGECQGVCTGADWSGSCTGACAGLFLGNCTTGTCTGSCNGGPSNVTLTDAGADGGDGGDGGGGGGAPTLEAPPNNADGNCKGFCAGVCSGGASGFCHDAPCLDFPVAAPPAPANFTGGNCFAGLCGGLCKSAGGTGTTTTCNGKCTGQKPQCDGICRGECTGARTELRCEGSLNCSQNTECANACEARAALATTCSEPTVFEVYAVSDPQLGAAFTKYGAKVGKAITELAYLRNALGFLEKRAYGDFVGIGLHGEVTRACVAKGNADVDAADAKIRDIITADFTARKFK